MEHEVFVPVAAEPLRHVLADPARVARAVPGLQQDAGEAPISGRLKVRVGGSSITYRGTLRITPHEDGSHTLDGDAAEARGTGTVKLALTLRLAPADGGTTLVFDGGVTGDGRIAELDAGVAATAGHRLLNRFAEALAASAAESEATEAPPDAAATPMVPEEPPVGPEESITGTDADVTPVAPPENVTPVAPPESEKPDSVGSADSEEPAAEPEPEPSGSPEPAAESEKAAESTPAGSAEPGSDVPADEVDEDRAHGATSADEVGRLPGEPVEPLEAADGRIHEVDNEPPAEAAHARRTMIGRSAEEVDHAPPRGRYAPVPAPASVRGSATLRWAAPAAALVVASVIVIGRALRRRR